MIALLPIAYSTGTSEITRDFISSFHCAIGTRYWYQLNPMEKTQCLRQYKNVKLLDFVGPDFVNIIVKAFKVCLQQFSFHTSVESRNWFKTGLVRLTLA